MNNKNNNIIIAHLAERLEYPVPSTQTHRHQFILYETVEASFVVPSESQELRRTRHSGTHGGRGRDTRGTGRGRPKGCLLWVPWGSDSDTQRTSIYSIINFHYHFDPWGAFFKLFFNNIWKLLCFWSKFVFFLIFFFQSTYSRYLKIYIIYSN